MQEGWTPLHCATRDCHINVVQQLLVLGGAGVAIDHQNQVQRNKVERVRRACCSQEGMTALGYATRACSDQAVHLLLSAGAAANIQATVLSKLHVTYCGTINSPYLYDGDIGRMEPLHCKSLRKMDPFISPNFFSMRKRHYAGHFALTR